MLVLAAQDGDSDAFSRAVPSSLSDGPPGLCPQAARPPRGRRDRASRVRAGLRAPRPVQRRAPLRRVGASHRQQPVHRPHARRQPAPLPATSRCSGDAALGPNAPEDALLRAEQAALIQRALASAARPSARRRARPRRRRASSSRNRRRARPLARCGRLAAAARPPSPRRVGAVDDGRVRCRQHGHYRRGQPPSAARPPRFGPITRCVQLRRRRRRAARRTTSPSSMGMVPGVPSMVRKPRPPRPLGCMSLLSLGGAQPTHVPAVAVPQVPAITATVPATPAPRRAAGCARGCRPRVSGRDRTRCARHRHRSYDSVDPVAPRRADVARQRRRPRSATPPTRLGGLLGDTPRSCRSRRNRIALP